MGVAAGGAAVGNAGLLGVVGATSRLMQPESR